MLTGWLASWLAIRTDCKPRFQFHQAKPGKTLERDLTLPVTSGHAHEVRTVCMSNRRVHECQ